MTKNSEWKIGIIGHTGMVGSEVFSYFKYKKFNTLGYSIDNTTKFGNSTWEEINNKCTIIFIAVPTPFDYKKRKANFEILKEVIAKITDGKVVVIKSTIWPGTTAKLQNKYPKLKLLFNPEFLSRSSSKKDFRNPDRQLIGYTNKSNRIAAKVLKILPKAKYSKIMKAEEAEMIKYAHNVFGAIRIVWANHLFDVSKKINLDYDIIKEAFAASEFIGTGMLRYMNIFHHGKHRGFGGPCFPKDINNYIEFCKKNGLESELISAVRNANLKLLKSQKLDEVKAEKLF